MSLLDADFKYVPAAQTDVTLTWRRFGYRPTTEAERSARQRNRVRRRALASMHHARIAPRNCSQAA